MKSPEELRYRRDTAIKSVTNLLNALETPPTTGPQETHLLESFRMVEREISGLLGHPDSPHRHTYLNYIRLLFPSGLERSNYDRDMIQLLGRTDKISVMHNGKASFITINPELRNPVKGVAQIIGKELTQKLFERRGAILSSLETPSNFWEESIQANNVALGVLNDYIPENDTSYNLSTKATATTKADGDKKPAILAEHNDHSPKQNSPHATSSIQKIDIHEKKTNAVTRTPSSSVYKVLGCINLRIHQSALIPHGPGVYRVGGGI